MRKVSRPYFKNKGLILGTRKTQKGELFPIAAVLTPLAGAVIGKILERGKKRVNKRLHQTSRKIILVRLVNNIGKKQKK